jgi:hypothetical protein
MFITLFEFRIYAARSNLRIINRTKLTREIFHFLPGYIGTTYYIQVSLDAVSSTNNSLIGILTKQINYVDNSIGFIG